MIAIPNMEKPKRCLECWSGLSIVINCEAGKGFWNADGDRIPPDCPIIDIVQCKDCINWNAEDGICNQWSDPHEFDIRETDPNGFCYYGERRSK